MTEHMIFVREQGQLEYDIIYATESIVRTEDGKEHPLQIEELHAMIREALGRNEEIAKISCDDISIRNVHGIRFMFKKHEPKLEVTFEGRVHQSNVGQQSSTGYVNFQPQVVPIAVPQHHTPPPSADNKWLTVLEKTPVAFGHSGTTINEHLFIFGGFVDEETSNNCLLLSDTRGGKFSRLRVRGEVPTPRERHSASLIGKKNLFLRRILQKRRNLFQPGAHF